MTRPPSSPGELPCHDLGRPTMIRLLPRTSDGVAESRLQSLDPGRASERPFASGSPAMFLMPGARAANVAYMLLLLFFFSFFSDFNNPMC